MGPTQPLIKWVPGLPQGVKRPGSDVDHPPPSSAAVKERVELYLYSPFWAFVAYSRVKCTITFIIIIIIINLSTAAFKAYCAIWVRRSNFRHQASPRVSPRESTQRQKVELWARNVREFCLNADLRVTFRDLLLAVKLQHGTDGFTSPPKEGVLRIFFFRSKNPTASAGCKLGYQRPAHYL